MKGKKGKKKKKKAASSVSSTKALSAKKPSVTSLGARQSSSISKEPKKKLTLTSNPANYDAQLKAMGIKAPKDQAKGAQKKPLAAKMGSAMNKKMQAKFAQS